MSTSPISERPAEVETGENENGQEAGHEAIAVNLDAELKAILTDVLGLAAEDAEALDEDSGLFGHLPELDSMAVAGLLTEMEDRLDIIIDDDDVDGEMLETYGGLLEFAQGKLSED